MGAEHASFIVRCQGEDRSGATRLQVVRVDRDVEVQLSEGSFLVRVSMDTGRVMERCFIRHIASGREAFVQGGSGLSTFVTECLLGRPGVAAETGDEDETGRSAR